MYKSIHEKRDYTVYYDLGCITAVEPGRFRERCVTGVVAEGGGGNNGKPPEPALLPPLPSSVEVFGLCAFVEDFF
ncbi:unnamed protein product [Gongylonema pulchrum]|uniref:Uncharacterized protein n=1 Tax=Gongylonema pulchrum TaxID=637853 RepID=A0A183E4A5_9BILA|nr:unnamed protein product [Gongylonema pulchrum]